MSIDKSKVQDAIDKDDWSEHWQSYAKSASENPAQKMRHDIILGAIKGLHRSIDLLLDIGSGQGDFIEKAVLKKCANKYVGFELSDAGVKISRSKVPQAEFIKVDLFSPPTEVLQFANQADVAICSDVIEHVDAPEEFCRLLMTYLKPGGYLFLTVPGGPMSEFDHHIGHRTHYKKKSIESLLLASGFKIENTTMAGIPFFNLYRLMVILRGKKLISDVEYESESSLSSSAASSVMKIFGFLFKFNLVNSRYGWQVFAVARRPS